MHDSHLATATSFEDRVVYSPEHHPGYTAWVAAFLYGNGDIGLSFDEIRRQPNPGFTPPSIEFLESADLAYLFSRTYIPTSHPELLQERVYLKSTDGGNTWKEFHRGRGKSGYRVGFPDGRLVAASYGGNHSPERGTDRNYTTVEESRDGGRTSRRIARLPAVGTHRFKKLRDGSLVILGPLAPTYGPGGCRPKSGARFPGEHYDHQAAIMHSPDGGYTWTGPHYVLPGVSAPEADFVELPDGRLLVINSSVQAGAAVRQFVQRVDTGFVCDPVMDIQKGAADSHNMQSGIVPEAIDITPDGVIIGARRLSAYACSNDLGATWHTIAGLPDCGYQPQVLCLPDGRFMAAWHRGTDSAFGQQDMCIGIHAFRLEIKNLPRPTALTLERSLSDDNSQFINAFAARLMVGDHPLPGKAVDLRVKFTWLGDGRVNPTPIDQTHDIRTAETDADGVARFVLADIDAVPDMHHTYDVQAIFTPRPADHLAPCRSVHFHCYNKTSKRNTPYAYPLYFAESPPFC